MNAKIEYCNVTASRIISFQVISNNTNQKSLTAKDFMYATTSILCYNFEKSVTDKKVNYFQKEGYTYRRLQALNFTIRIECLVFPKFAGVLEFFHLLPHLH